MSSLHQLQNHIVWKSSKEDARIISRMHRLSTEEFTRMGMYNLGGEHGWLAPIRGPKKTGSGGQLLALTMHKWGTTSQGSQSPLAEQLLESHVHQYAATFSAQAHTISWRICTCLRIRVAYRCTYGGVYSSSHRRLKESNGRRRRREGRTRPLAAPQRLISSSWGVGFQGYN